MIKLFHKRPDPVKEIRRLSIAAEHAARHGLLGEFIYDYAHGSKDILESLLEWDLLTDDIVSKILEDEE